MSKGTHSADWRKSSYSNGAGECVEVAQGDGVRVRDTKDRDGMVLRVSAETWRAFASALKRR